MQNECWAAREVFVIMQMWSGRIPGASDK